MGVGKDKNSAKTAAELRRQAEKLLKANNPESGILHPDDETKRLLHELQVHQLELEMQNAELQHARDEQEMALEKYTGLYDFAPVGYFTLNRKGAISAANLRGASILGIERASLLGRYFGLFVTEESRPQFAVFLGEVFANQSKQSCEVTLTTEVNLPLIVQIEAVVFGSGQECHAVLIDITERKQAEERIAHFASFPELNPNPVLEVDLFGRIIYFNPATVNILETAGVNTGDAGVFLPADFAAIVEQWDRLHESTFYREIVINELIFAETLFLTPRFNAVRIYAYDITERRRAEESLRRSEALYRAIGESLDYGIWVCAPDGRNIYASDSFLQLVGITRDQCADFGWVEALHPDDAEETVAAWKECVLKGGTWDREHRYRGADGQWHPILARGVPVRDDQGTITTWAGINLDISKMKRTEKRLRDSEEHLRLALSVAQQANNDLAAANIELEAFNYSVSHDLRSPLAIINGYCQMVLELCGSNLDGRTRGYIREMYDGTQRMNQLIDALLVFSGITRIELRHDKVDLSKMAEEIAMVLKGSDPERLATFRIADGITVEGDAVLLRSVLNNLIGNAWKYSGSREGAVIEFGAMEIDGKSVCFVKDNGPGFDRAHLDKLFIPFQRLPGTKVEGLGIGLATVDRIIRRHGGRVWAEGEPGRGACFFFTLAAD